MRLPHSELMNVWTSRADAKTVVQFSDLFLEFERRSLWWSVRVNF